MDRTRSGVWLAVGCGLSFAASGPLMKSLLATGWSPAAVTGTRLAGSAVLMLVIAAFLDRVGLRTIWRHRSSIVGYGIVVLAGVQATFLLSLQYLNVGVALMIQALAPVVVIGWEWARRRRPPALTLFGAGVALVGASLVIDVFSTDGVNMTGVAWAGLSMLGNACFFLLSRQQADGPSPVVLLAGSMVIATVTMAVVVATGLLTARFADGAVTLAEYRMPWYTSVSLLVVVATVIAYLCGLAGGARISSTLMSLVLLCEVLFAAVLSWLLVGEVVTPIQVVGGVVTTAGIVLARIGDDADADQPPQHPSEVGTDRTALVSTARAAS